MKNEILAHLDDPGQLEKLYRTDRPAFRNAFTSLYPELKDNLLARYWNERLNFTTEDISFGSRKNLLVVLIACIIAGLIAKLPAFLAMDEEFFYQRNVGFILLPLLTAYFTWKNKVPAGTVVFMFGVMLVGLVFINLLPNDPNSNTLVLSCIHLLPFLWSVFGFAFIGGHRRNSTEKRLGFLRYNGDLLVMTGLIMIAGAALSAITVGLFSLIGIKIGEFYFNNIVVFALPSAPILATYLTQTNPQLVGKVSPVIAKIFSPLVLVMLVSYLIAIIYSGKDPYNDREFLFLFNALLIGVMAIIFFSIAETKTPKSSSETWVLFLLSMVTIIVNGVALSAIVFRISEWGMTPNRAAVLGSNVLILINLLLVAVQLFKMLLKKNDLTGVGKVISFYLPVYVIWTIIVTFIFPFLFGFN